MKRNKLQFDRLDNQLKVTALTYVTHRLLIFLKYRSTFVDPTKGSKIMSKPRALPDRPGIIQHGYGSNIRDRDEGSRSGCHRWCGSVLRRGKRRRELPKKKQVQVSGEQRRKTARQV